MQRKTIFIISSALAVLIIGLSACQQGESAPTEDQVPSTIVGSPTGAPQVPNSPTDDQPSDIETKWGASPHAHTYVLDESGINSTCARCHAPINYIPSMNDMPESCATCKFEIEPPPPLIEENSWDQVPCNVCHRVKKGVVDPEYAWLSIPPIDEYEEVATTADLCLKCHLQIDIPGHETPDLSNAHAGYTCTECHDAHSTAASCSADDCHADVLNPTASIPGHDEDHQAVTCWACHDGAGLEVGPTEEDSWVTFLPGSLTPYASHNITKQALCERCHFTNNPWKLSEELSTNQP